METHSSSCMSSYLWAENILFKGEEVTLEGRHPLAYEAESAPAGANGVLFLPWLQGAACPHYDDAARGAYIGMSLASARSDLCRATLEGICFENRMMLETLLQSDIPSAKSLRVIGGAANNEFWNQMQADIYGIPVETVTAKESSALGAAVICAVASGLYGNYKDACANMTHVLRKYNPDADKRAAYKEIYAMWDQCYSGLSQKAFKSIYDFQKRISLL